MPPKRASRTPQPAPQRVYDLRKTHIPRISPPPEEGYQGRKNTNGVYVPRAAATKAAAIRRRAAAARAARANEEADASPGPPQTRLRTPNRRSTTPQARRSATPGKRVQFALQNAQPKPSSAAKSNASPQKEALHRRAASTSTEPETTEADEASEASYDEEEVYEEGVNEDHDENGPEDEESGQMDDEGSADEDDNLPSIDDRDVDTEEEASARALYDAKEKYRELIGRRVLDEARRRYPEGVQRQPREVETSDLEAALEDAMRAADYPVGIILNIRVNKKPYVKKSLPDSQRRSFNMEDVEKAFLSAIAPTVGEEEYQIMARRVTVKHSSGRGGTTHHDFDDFDTANGSHILSIIDKHHSRHRTGMIEAHFDINVQCDAILPTPKRSRQPEPPSSDIPSSPPSFPPKKRQNRSSRLQEQHSTRLDTIRVAGNFQRQLMDRWRCHDPNCTNKDNYCFPDPTERTKHFNITAVQHEAWANAISNGEATIQNPPVKMLRYWEEHQGALNRQSRQPARQTFIQQTKSSLERLAEMQQQMHERMLEARMYDQMDALEEKQERREERNERRRMEQERREHELAHARLMYMPPHYAAMPYSHGQSPRPMMPISGQYPAAQYPRAPITPQAASRASQKRRSSPIDETTDEYELLESFFYWKNVNTPNPRQKEKWNQVKEIVFQNDWTIQDLKDMEDDASPMYQRAIKAGISDGFTRLIQRELQAFKRDVRRQKEAHEEELQAIATLGQLGHQTDIEGSEFMRYT